MAEPPQLKSVIIVGGSLAGLMHALTLISLPSPPSVRILERSPTNLLHNQGAGIVAANETQRFFAEYVHPGKDIAITSYLRHYLNREGEVIPDSVDNRQQRMTSWDLLYHLLRWRVEGLQSDYVKDLQDDKDTRPRAQYESGCTVTNVEDVGKRVKLTWTHQDHGEQMAIADLIIAADGASSAIRQIMRPDVNRQYAGYVAWRGTVPEDRLSPSAKTVFVEKFTFYHSHGVQVLGYLIPGFEGKIGAGQRLFNWVWYVNYEDGSEHLEKLMTDVNGRRHAVTLPVNTMQPKVWESQKAYANEILPPQYAEAVQKTDQPFIQAVTDVISPENSFFNGKLLLVGDALAGFRPHTAASTGQAAHNALELGRWLRGEIVKQEYDASVHDFAVRVQRHGVELGERSQFGRHPFAA